MSNYWDYRKNKIESGQRYQDFIVDLLFTKLHFPVVQYASRLYQEQVGESLTGVEIKHDEKFVKTGNLWIEVAEKAVPRPGAYADSGIQRGDNTWLYVIGDYDTVFIFAKLHLQALKASGKYNLIENCTRTSVGFLLPMSIALHVAVSILRPNAECLVAKGVQDLHELGRRLHEIAKGNGAQRSLFEEGGDADAPA